MPTATGQPTFRPKENRYYIWAKGPDGKRATPVYGKTPELCLEAKKTKERELADAAKVQPISPVPTDSPPGSFQEFVYKIYIPHIHEKSRPRTNETYDGELRYHILPTLWEKQVSEIGYDDIQLMKVSLKYHDRKGRVVPGKKLSKSKTRDVVMRVKEIMKLAHQLGKTSKLDWQVVVAPDKPKKKKRVPLPEDFATTLMAKAAASTRPWMVGPLFAAQYLALREGEACGLKKTSINRKNLTITIENQRQYIRGQGFVDSPVKGRGDDPNDRVIGVPRELIDWLDGFSSKKSEYVFVNNAGNPCNPRALGEMTPLYCIAAGLPRVTYHDLRSYSASNLHALGFDIVTISSILGHEGYFRLSGRLKNPKKESVDVRERVCRKPSS